MFMPKVLDPDGFTGESYQHFKGHIIFGLHVLFQKEKKKAILTILWVLHNYGSKIR